MAGAVKRSHKAGEAMGEAVVEMVHLMYQNNTALNFLVGLVTVLMDELARRDEDGKNKSGKNHRL